MTKEELLKSQMSAEETNGDKQTYSIEPIDDTPFTMVVNEEGAFASMGNYRLTPIMKNDAEVIDILQTQMYNIILNMIAICQDAQNKSKTN